MAGVACLRHARLPAPWCAPGVAVRRSAPAWRVHHVTAPRACRRASCSRSASTAAPASPDAPSSAPHQLYSFGEGYLGCLGLPTYDDVPEAQPIEALQRSQVVSVDCGWGHSATVTNDGQLLVCGRTHDFANTLRLINLHRGPSWLAHAINFVSDRIVGVDLVPHLVPTPDGVRFASVACSPGALTIGVADDGRVFCYGSNDHGQCGVGYLSPSVYDMEAVDGVVASHVCAGFQHVLAVTPDGQLLAWGRGDRGQLGLGDREAYKSPLQVLGAHRDLLSRRVVAAAAGFAHSAVLTDDGGVWVFGKMQSGRSENEGHRVPDQLQPLRVELDTSSTPVAVSCGQAHTCVLTDDNQVWMRGLRGRGVWYDATGAEPDDYSLRVMDPGAKLTAFDLMQVEAVKVDLGPSLNGARVVQLVSGVHHSYAVLDDGRVLMWGWRLHAVELEALRHVHVTRLAVGFGHTLAVGRPRT